MILRCTAKLLKELRVQPQEIDAFSPVASWHCNLLTIERRKCVLFTHDLTLFSLFVPGLKRPDFEQISHIFGETLFRSLRLLDLEQDQIERMLDWSRVITLTKTNNRSVLGSMNEMAFILKYAIQMADGLPAANVDELTTYINTVPFKAIDYQFPKERMQQLLSAQGTA